MKQAFDYDVDRPDVDTQILDQVVTIRLAAEMRRLISTAAHTKGVTISEEIRRRLAGSFTAEGAPG